MYIRQATSHDHLPINSVPFFVGQINNRYTSISIGYTVLDDAPVVDQRLGNSLEGGLK